MLSSVSYEVQFNSKLLQTTKASLDRTDSPNTTLNAGISCGPNTPPLGAKVDEVHIHRVMWRMKGNALRRVDATESSAAWRYSMPSILVKD
jgi:hypothetical protein